MSQANAAPENPGSENPAPEDAAAKRRARQTLINLLLSLGASLAIVIGLVLIVPRDDSNRIRPVDYVAIAADAQSTTTLPVLVPKIATGWWSNAARWKDTKAAADGVASWYVGFVGPTNQYIGMTQAFNINPTWLAQQLKNNAKTGEVPIGGKTWQVYEAIIPNDPPSTREFEMVLRVKDDVVLIYGTAKPKDFYALAAQVNSEIDRSY